jgi:hypothetical protein
MTSTYDPDRPSVTTPDKRYRYQLWKLDDGSIAADILTVWGRSQGNDWATGMMIYLEPDLSGPRQVSLPNGHPAHTDSEALIDAYILAAGHVWAARRAGLWPEGDR